MIKIGDIEALEIRIATDEETETLPAHDNTAMVAINTCPVWGLVHHGLKRRMPGSARAMALEAGGACHEVFAAARLISLREPFPDHFQFHGERLFGKEKFKIMCATLKNFEGDEFRTQMLNFCLEALFRSGFYDDPRDRRRTMTNLEEACINYLDRVRWRRPVWIEDYNDPTKLVGIEIPFNLTVTARVWDDDFHFRFIGRLDGLHWDGPDHKRIELEENKTASRLDAAWSESFSMSHQVTGYLIAASTIIGQDLRHAVVHGLAIPQPRAVDITGIERVPVQRADHQITEWLYWAVQSAWMYKDFVGHELDAPRYTHSCNRYFRPCSFIPLCYSPPDERAEMLDMMTENKWNPLDDGSDE